MKTPGWARRSSALALYAYAALLLLSSCSGAAPRADTLARPPATAVPPSPTREIEPTSAASARSRSDTVLRIQSWNFPATLDPQDSSVAGEIGVETLNYEGLTRFDKDLRTVPGAAEDWSANADSTEFTFHLRDGLTYSDGSPLVAKDFVAAIKRSLDPRGIVGSYHSAFFMIKGAEALINAAVPTDTEKLPALFDQLGIATPDARTIVVSLTQPTPYFPTLAALWVTYPAKDELVRQGGENWWEDPANQIGNGPFQITTIDRDNSIIELTANNHYWQGPPKLQGVRIEYFSDPDKALAAYKNGDLDILQPDPAMLPELKSDPLLSKEYTEYAGSCTMVMAFNLKKDPFDKLAVREAFAYAFDREHYIHDMRKGDSLATVTWIPPGYPGYDSREQSYSFDLRKARQALARAGYPDGKGFPVVKLAYSNSNPANQTRAEYLARMFLDNLGVTITLSPVDIRTLRAMREKNSIYPQLLNGEGWCADYPDQQNWLSVYWHSRSQFSKKFGYKNEHADALMDQADIESDPGKRARLYAEAQRLIVGDVPAVIWGNTKNYYLIKPYVKGLDLTPQDPVFPGQQTGLLNVTIGR